MFGRSTKTDVAGEDVAEGAEEGHGHRKEGRESQVEPCIPWKGFGFYALFSARPQEGSSWGVTGNGSCIWTDHCGCCVDEVMAWRNKTQEDNQETIASLSSQSKAEAFPHALFLTLFLHVNLLVA